MDKPRNQDGSQERPGIDGPDYFSLVIEWDPNDEDKTAAPEVEDEVTDRQIRHWAVDAADEASMESFPASDAPASGSSHAAPTEASASAIECEVQATEPSSWLRRHLGQIAFAFVGLGAVFGITRWRQHAARSAPRRCAR